MRTHVVALTAVMASAIALGLDAQQIPTFRASTRRVGVDVAVHRGNVPVPGLSSADFTLTDNGVKQTIEMLNLTEVPVDVSLVVDVSGSTADQLERYQADVRAIAAELRPIDRLRVLGFSSAVQEVSPLGAAAELSRLDTLETRGFSSVYDGIMAALLRPAPTGRRQLVVAFTDGIENRSILDGDQVLAISKRTEAVLHIITPGVGMLKSILLPIVREYGDKPPPDPGRAFFPMGSPGAPAPAGPSATLGVTELARLQTAVDATGGEVHAGASTVGDFKKIFRDFLSNYILYFEPTKVSSTGWHALQVKVRGGYTVRARRGYFAGSSN